MDQLSFIPLGEEMERNGDAEPESDQIPDAEFLATPLHLLANDLTPPPLGEGVGGGVTQPQAQSPGTCPAFPGRSTPSHQIMRNLQNLEPECSLEWDNLRQIKHADPYGRVTLGRKFSFRTFIVEALTDGALLLRPAVIMEERQFDNFTPSSFPRGTSLERRKGGSTRERSSEAFEVDGDGGRDERKVHPELFLRCPTMR